MRKLLFLLPLLAIGVVVFVRRPPKVLHAAGCDVNISCSLATLEATGGTRCMGLDSTGQPCVAHVWLYESADGGTTWYLVGEHAGPGQAKATYPITFDNALYYAVGTCTGQDPFDCQCAPGQTGVCVPQ